VKNASTLKPPKYSAPNRFIPWVREFTAATCEPFSTQGMQNRAAEDLPTFVESPNESPGLLLRYWEPQTNATVPPYSDDYVQLEQHLYAQCRLNRNREIIDDLADKNSQFKGKRGAEPGWLADDQLTRDWLELVQQYRSECDASDRRRLLNDPATGETTS
jgi:hypothetical protein